MLLKTKIRWIYVIFAGLLAMLAGYQSCVSHRFLSLNRALSQTHFRSAFICLDLLRIQARLEEGTKGWLDQGDASSSSKLKQSSEDFEASLSRLKSHANLGNPLQETDRLVQFWNQFTSDLETVKRVPPDDTNSEITSKLDVDLQGVETQIQTVYLASLESISHQIEASNEAIGNAARNSWLMAATTLFLGLLLSFWHYRSFSVPLTNLDEGTQAIAEGKLFVRLDTSRRDEFSRIAKNINALAQQMQKSDPSGKQPENNK